MAEPVATGEASELVTLRKTNLQLIAKHARDHAKIIELENGTSALQAKLSEASESLKEATVAGPLKAMAESMSNVPDLFLEQFSKHYKIENIKGALTLFNTDGKPVLGKDGKMPLPFERQALVELLTTGEDTRARTFKAIVIASHSSGAGLSTSQHVTGKTKKAPAFYYGFR
jgi:hypothetical protein